jgi:phosphatidylethanolamine/phosphatidyl-N-methylethanolamine N-methyltransferase
VPGTLNLRAMLSDYRAFLTQFLRNYQTTGAVIPSGRKLASALCRHVGGGAPQKILEAGPGTGAVTGVVVERMRPVDQLWMVELNPTFAAHLRKAFEQRPSFRAVADRCHLIEGSVQALGNQAEFDIVVSGLPLNNFSPQDVRAILEAYSKLLKPTGILSFFQYILIRDAKTMVSVGSERKRLKGVGAAIDGVLREHEFAREWVWPNVPPAWVHHLRF